MMINAERIRRDLIVIGASAGGLDPLMVLVAKLPPDIPATISVVIHMPAQHNNRLPFLLAKRTTMRVIQAVDREPLMPGTIAIAPPDLHLRVRADHMSLDRGPKQHFTRPAIDPLFVSAACLFQQRVVGVLLSGRGEDGVHGLIRIKAQGGITLVQAPSEAAYPSMPRMALEKDDVDAALPVARLARVLGLLATGASVKA